MRSREQFKAYVYAKAEAEQAQGRKRRRLMGLHLCDQRCFPDAARF